MVMETVVAMVQVVVVVVGTALHHISGQKLRPVACAALGTKSR